MTTTPNTTPLFPLGRVVSTPGALETFADEGTSGLELLRRHVTGDYGDLSDEDIAENELAIKQGFRILSSYILPRTEETIWIITEADRSVTTFLRPSEY